MEQPSPTAPLDLRYPAAYACELAATPVTAANPAGPRRFLKDVASFGSYSHPVHNWKLDIDGKRMDKWCAAFDAMQKDGVKVPVYADHKPGAANCLGYCTAMFRGSPDILKKHPEFCNMPLDKAPTDPNRLYAIHEFPDEQSAATANRVGQVSVLIDRNLRNGSGKNYGEAVRHVAVTPEPIVAGQGGFAALAHAENEEAPDMYVLGIVAGPEASHEQGAGSMLTTDELTALKTHFPAEEAEKITAETGVTALCDRFVALSLNAQEVEAERKALKAQLEAQGSAAKLDPDVADGLQEGAEIEFSALPDTLYSPATKKALYSLLAGTKENPNVYALSRKATGGTVSLARGVAAILKANKPLPLGERTGSQRALELSRVNQENDVKKNVTEPMIEMANAGR